MSANPTSPAISETSICHISDVASVTSHVSTNFGSPNLCVTRLLSSEPANEDSFVVAPVPRSSPLPSSHQSEENNEDSIDSVIV